MNRLDYLLKERERIDKEIASLSNGEAISDNVKLHVRHYKKNNWDVNERTDWALSIKRINLKTHFTKWEPIVASDNREEVLEHTKIIINDLLDVLEEGKSHD